MYIRLKSINSSRLPYWCKETSDIDLIKLICVKTTLTMNQAIQLLGRRVVDLGPHHTQIFLTLLQNLESNGILLEISDSPSFSKTPRGDL